MNEDTFKFPERDQVLLDSLSPTKNDFYKQAVDMGIQSDKAAILNLYISQLKKNMAVGEPKKALTPTQLKNVCIESSQILKEEQIYNQLE